MKTAQPSSCSTLSTLAMNCVLKNVSSDVLSKLICVSKKMAQCVESTENVIIRNKPQNKRLPLNNVHVLQIFSVPIIIDSIDIDLFPVSSVRSLTLSSFNCVTYNVLSSILDTVSLTSLSFCFIGGYDMPSKDYVNTVVSKQPHLQSLKIIKDLSFNSHLSTAADVVEITRLTELTSLRIFAYSDTFSTLPSLNTLNVFVCDSDYFNSTINQFTCCSTLENLIIRGDITSFSEIHNVTNLTHLATFNMLDTDIVVDQQIGLLSNFKKTKVYVNGFAGIEDVFLSLIDAPSNIVVVSEIHMEEEDSIPALSLSELKDSIKFIENSSVLPHLISIFSDSMVIQATLLSLSLPRCYEDIYINTETFNCSNLLYLQSIQSVAHTITFENVSHLHSFSVLTSFTLLQELTLRGVDAQVDLHLLPNLKRLGMIHGRFQNISNLKIDFIKSIQTDDPHPEELLSLPNVKTIAWSGDKLPFDFVLKFNPQRYLHFFVELQHYTQEEKAILAKKNIYLDNIIFEFFEDEAEPLDEAEEGEEEEM